MEFEIIVTVDGMRIPQRPTDIYAWADAVGRDAAPHNRKRLRAELQNAPEIEGLYGPMWGGERNGKPVARYECADTYAALSQ